MTAKWLFITLLLLSFSLLMYFTFLKFVYPDCYLLAGPFFFFFSLLFEDWIWFLKFIFIVEIVQQMQCSGLMCLP